MRHYLWIHILTFLTCVTSSQTLLAQWKWSQTLSSTKQASILWEADMETNDFSQWNGGDGGGIFNTYPLGKPWEATATVSGFAHYGSHSARVRIQNAWQGNGNRAVRLMRWLDGSGSPKNLPKTAFYNTWMYIPENYDPSRYDSPNEGDGWWIVFQFKSQDTNTYQKNEPVFALNIYNDYDPSRSNPWSLGFRLANYDENGQWKRNYTQSNLKPLPTLQWVHLEARYVASGANNGSIRIWQDGQQIFNVKNVKTLHSNTDRLHFGVANYTNHIDGGATPGTATLYFDDTIIAKQRLGTNSN